MLSSELDQTLQTLDVVFLFHFHPVSICTSVALCVQEPDKDGHRRCRYRRTMAQRTRISSKAYFYRWAICILLTISNELHTLELSDVISADRGTATTTRVPSAFGE